MLFEIRNSGVKYGKRYIGIEIQGHAVYVYAIERLTLRGFGMTGSAMPSIWIAGLERGLKDTQPGQPRLRLGGVSRPGFRCAWA